MTGLILYSNFQDFRDLSSGRRLKAEIAKVSKFAFSGVGLLEKHFEEDQKKDKRNIARNISPSPHIIP